MYVLGVGLTINTARHKKFRHTQRFINIRQSHSPGGATQ